MIRSLKISHVWPEAGHVVLLDGMALPITDYLDECGDICEPPEAVRAVAGMDGVGWITFALPGPETRH